MSDDSAADDRIVTFYDNLVPSLKAGQYTISVGQTLSVDSAKTIAAGGNPAIPAQPQLPVTQRFIVRGPRFVLDPADLQQLFPPANGLGAYGEHLPMIVLNKRAFPWERELKLDVAGADRYPWVALLVFADDELQPPDLAESKQPAAGSLQNPTRVAQLPLGQLLKPPAGIRGPDLRLESDEDPQKIICTVIDLPAALFSALVPARDELPLLAHVRQVGTAHKVPAAAKHAGWFSVVCANRQAVPATGDTPRANIVHLVSLEGFEDLLGADAPAQLDASITTVRMISLFSWTFSCLKEPQENFRQLMLGLAADAGDRGEKLLLRLPLAETGDAPLNKAQAAARQRLGDGYLPLSYLTRSGEQTFAWYRGPLAPVPTASLMETSEPSTPENRLAPRSVAEAMIFDPATGVFDQSYGVAFQTGRSLALASKPFATGLLHWRRQAHTLIDLLLEQLRSPQLRATLQARQILDDAGNLSQTGVDDLAALLDSHLLPDLVKAFLAAGLADLPAAPAAPPAAPATDSRMAPIVPVALSGLMRSPAVAALLARLSGLDGAGTGAGDLETGLLVRWLARRSLLYDLPFANLVPDARLLPVESIRFFYIDQNWIDSLLDGALSVGMQSSRDSLFHRLMRDPLHRAAEAALATASGQPNGPAQPGRPVAGFLLRSAVVSGWPGLEVRAQDAGGAPIYPLRLDRLSPEVMIGLYPALPARIAFDEPSEGLVCGFEDEGIRPRYLPGTVGADSHPIGSFYPLNEAAPLAIGSMPRRPAPAIAPALQIAGLVERIAQLYPDPRPALGPAALAVVLVRVPEQMLFSVSQ